MDQPLDVAVVILTKDEERNVGRAVGSVVLRVKETFVLDSGSTDRTRDIARELGARVFENPWPGYAAQRNWALDHLPITATWIFFLDADEFVDAAFLDELQGVLASAPEGLAGVSIRRWLEWLGARVSHGGLRDARILRVLRRGRGRCGGPAVNEHLVVDGDEAHLATPVGHRNDNGLARWLRKQRGYAPLEAEALLDELVRPVAPNGELARARMRRRRLYAALPPFARAFLRFLHTMLVAEGFRDGLRGASYHLLHDLGLMLLVDAHFCVQAARRLAKVVRLEAA